MADACSSIELPDQKERERETLEFFFVLFQNSRWRDSNSRPSAYKADAITTMLHRLFFFVSFFFSFFFLLCSYVCMCVCMRVHIHTKKLRERESDIKSKDNERNKKKEKKKKRNFFYLLFFSLLVMTGIEPATGGLLDHCSTD